MNYTITLNPYEDSNTVVTTRGVMTDAKVAKLNNDKKRPALVRHWEELKPMEEPASVPSVPKNYLSLLSSIGITPVNHGSVVVNSGAKKLRVNKIVNEKARNIYNNVERVEVTPQVEVAQPKIEEQEIKIIDALTPNVAPSPIDNRGRHERTGEIPVAAIKEAVQNNPAVNNTPTASSYTSRIERNTMANMVNNKPEVKQEPKSGDMDLYNNLLHNASQGDDVSRQLQGARNQLTIEKEENRKLAEQYGEAVKELAKLKEDIEVTKKQKEQKAKEELSMTLKSIENLQKENLERTSDLTSIQSEIARLKAEKQAMEASNYE